MADVRQWSVSGVVIRQGEVLLVRQAYGAAKGQLVIPGGYLSEGEMPELALEREILEESGVRARADRLLAMRFSLKDWWAIFSAEYLSGEPTSDGKENSEALFLPLETAVRRPDLTETTRQILLAYGAGEGWQNAGFVPSGADPSRYAFYEK